MDKANNDKDIGFNLGERVKELNALHRTARILQDDERPAVELMAEIARLLPGAWLYPETAEARILFDGILAATPGFEETRWIQTAHFSTRTGESGRIDVCYRVEHPLEFEGPFLAEERDLIDSLGEMLRSFFQRRIAIQVLERTRDELEEQVARRTAELRMANQTLEAQVLACREAQGRIEHHRQQLRRMASELSLTEARERRSIAMDLHDHIGQALAFTKIRIAALRGDTMFCGFDSSFDAIEGLLEQTILYVRNLTFEISPPILYDLGLECAIEWLAERFLDKYGLKTSIEITGPDLQLGEDLKVTCFKSVSELLTNVVKHSGTSLANVYIHRGEERLRITVEDRGAGFDDDGQDFKSGFSHGFGLFSIRERIRCFGGEMCIESTVGIGSKICLSLPLATKGA